MSDPYIPFYTSDWLGGTGGLTAAEKGVYITLLALIYEGDGPVDLTEKSLARRCGTSATNLRKALKALKEDGKIVEIDGALMNPRAAKEIAARIKKRNANRASAESRWQKKPNKNNQPAMRTQSERNANQNQSQKVTPYSPPGDVKDRFEEFWNLYPHRNGAKKGKAAARKKWAQAIKRADPSLIISKAKAFRSDRQAVDGYAPDPAKWLNQERWTDDIETVRTTQSEEVNYEQSDAYQAGRSAMDAFLNGDQETPTGSGEESCLLLRGPWLADGSTGL